jgi:hypothetical protein
MIHAMGSKHNPSKNVSMAVIADMKRMHYDLLGWDSGILGNVIWRSTDPEDPAHRRDFSIRVDIKMTGALYTELIRNIYDSGYARGFSDAAAQESRK